MTDQRLLASVVVFRELYDNNKDIYDVLTEFIRATISLNSMWSFNSTDCTLALEKTFAFKIPEAVVKSCLKNKFKRSGEIDQVGAAYSITTKFDKTTSIQSEFESKQGEYAEIISLLTSHIEKVSNTLLTATQKERLGSDFNRYLLGEKVSEHDAYHFSYFILANRENPQFLCKLNRIEEGLVLYTGIKHSSDINHSNIWMADLTIFLDTELLFSATGLNGELYKKIFDEFYSLTKEINANKNKRGSISFRYLDEVKNEIDSFFSVAEDIIGGTKNLDSSKTAMVNITNGCITKSDVMNKKAKFLSELNVLKIEREKSFNYYLDEKYNLESSSTITKLLAELKLQSSDEPRIGAILKEFTKINCLRSGQSNLGLESVKAILMTANYITHRVSRSNEVHTGNGAIPFATDIDFMTEKLWIKLGKGFGGEQAIPTSFDVVTKAQLVLSTQINHFVSEQHKALRSQFKNGQITKDEAAQLHIELRNKPNKPEDISIETIGSPLSFMNDDFIENVLREKSLLEHSAKEGRIAIDTLHKIQHQNKLSAIRPLKFIAKRQFYLFSSLAYFFIPIFLINAFYGFYTPNTDTPLSLAFNLLSVFTSVLPLIKYKLINKHLWRFSKDYYRSELLNLDLAKIV